MTLLRVKLQILEGNNFHLLEHNSSLQLNGTLDKVSLSSDPIPLSSVVGIKLDIKEEMVWKMSKRSFQRSRATKALKLDCVNISTLGTHRNVGYIILSLKEVTDSQKCTPRWRRLLGSCSSVDTCPELLISFCVEDCTPKLDIPSDSSSAKLSSTPTLVAEIGGLVYVGDKQHCTAQFQLTCNILRLENLNQFNKNLGSSADNPLQVTVQLLGQTLKSKLFAYKSHVHLGEKFVFDIMSTTRSLTTYLKKGVFVTVDLFSGDEKISTCSKMIDTLSIDRETKIMFCVDEKGDHDILDPRSCPCMELEVALQALDSSSGAALTAGPLQRPELVSESSEAPNVPETEDKDTTAHVKQVDVSKCGVKDDIENFFSCEPQIIDEDEYPRDQRSNSPANSEPINHQDGPAQQPPLLSNPADTAVSASTSNLKLGIVEMENLPNFRQNKSKASSKTNPRLHITDSEQLVKIVEELEEWKIHEKLKFAKDLEVQQQALLDQWEAAHRSRLDRLEGEKQGELEAARQLTARLARELQAVKQLNQEAVAEEDKLRQLASTLQSKYHQKVTNYQLKLKESKSKIVVLQRRVQELQSKLHVAEKRQDSQPQGSEAAELSRLRDKLRELELSLQQCQQEKASYVRKWLLSQQQRTKVNNCLQQDPCAVTLDAEQRQLMSERSSLAELRRELDQLGRNLSMVAISQSGTAVEPQSEVLHAPPATELHRLERERDIFLQSGAYTTEDRLIKELNKAIENSAKSA